MWKTITVLLFFRTLASNLPIAHNNCKVNSGSRLSQLIDQSQSNYLGNIQAGTQLYEGGSDKLVRIEELGAFNVLS